MPELPEVETVVRTLRPAVVGRQVESFRLLRADFASPAGFDWPAAVVGRRVEAVDRRAKRIVFRLEDGQRFFAHLGMTGRITVGPAGREPARHTHVALRVGEAELHFTDPRRFGGLVWLGETDGDEQIGPEPFEMRPADLADRLSRTRRAVKTALLDQRLIAGLGNIYADEALFRAGLTRAEVGRLSRAIKATLDTAIRRRGSTLRDYVDADGNRGGFQRFHQVYDRAGHPCRRCRAPVVRIVLGGRSTHYCPTCQPE